MNPPKWLGPTIAVAKHMDEKASWPKWARLLHKWFIAKNCPCCKQEEEWNK